MTIGYWVLGINSMKNARLLYPMPGAQYLLPLALGFVWVCFISLLIQTGSAFLLVAPVTLSLVAVGGELFLRRAAPNRDPLLWHSAVLLMGFGLVVIARVAPNFLLRQTLWVCLGALAMCGVSWGRFSLRWLRRFKYTWLLAGLLLLSATLFLGVNPGGQGAPLWLGLLGIFFQPAEALRLLMIAFLAAFYAERVTPAAGRSPAWAVLPSLAPALLMGGVALALLAVQQDLGAGALLLLTFLFMLYLATGRGRFSLMGFGALMIAIAIGGQFSARVALRIQTWLRPFADPLERSFQIAQSLIAIASGNILGQGVGQGYPAFVPAVHTDFPFVAIAEEFGLIGSLSVIGVFAVIVLRGWRVARYSPDGYGRLLAGGIAASFAVQVFVIIGGNVALVPLTGVTLPFISYGGSSLFVSCVALGLLVRLSADRGGSAPLPALKIAPLINAGMLAACGLAAAYWGVVSSPALAARDDNPRRVLAEQAIQRGRILARDGQQLAVSKPITITRDPLVSRLPAYARVYALPQAAPLVGYYSLDHGVGGVEEQANAVLRGQTDFWAGLLHHPQRGADVTTTLDVGWQTGLAAQLAGDTGGAVALNWRTGEILAMSSAPFFNPATLDKEWDTLKQNPSAPMLNRAAKGAYPVGGLGLDGYFAGAQTAAPLDVAVALAKLQGNTAISPTLVYSGVAPAAQGDPRGVGLPINQLVARPSGGGVLWQAELRGDTLVVWARER